MPQVVRQGNLSAKFLFLISLFTLLYPMQTLPLTAKDSKQSKDQKAQKDPEESKESKEPKEPKEQVKDPRFQKSFSNYSQCKKSGLSKTSKEEWDKSKAQAITEHCNEMFPLAALYQDCKKKAIKSSAGKASGLNEKLKECRDELGQMSLSDKNYVPFFFKEGSMFFADQGMNHSIPADNLKLSNFDCSKVKDDLRTPEKAEYFLFGNHPRWLQNFRDKKIKALQELLKLPKNVPAAGFFVPKLGKIYRNILKPNASVFFPSSVCAYSRQTPAPFSGLSLYYLLEGGREPKVHPYVGVSFYRPGFADLTVKEAGDELLERLTSGTTDTYKRVPGAKGSPMIYIASQEIPDFDSEGDPRDVCKFNNDSQKRHHFIAVVKPRSTEPKQVEYILVANVEKLCDFGDSQSLGFK